MSVTFKFDVAKLKSQQETLQLNYERYVTVIGPVNYAGRSWSQMMQIRANYIQLMQTVLIETRTTSLSD